MKEIEILGDNRFETFTKTRDGCRAIVVKDGMILLTHERNSGWWLPLRDAIEIFSKHQSYADVSEEKRGSYFREYTVLMEYMNR